jgi:hypothetical protein
MTIADGRFCDTSSFLKSFSGKVMGELSNKPTRAQGPNAENLVKKFLNLLIHVCNIHRLPLLKLCDVWGPLPKTHEVEIEIKLSARQGLCAQPSSARALAFDVAFPSASIP